MTTRVNSSQQKTPVGIVPVIGYKRKRFKVHLELSLKHLFPEDNFYRQIEKAVDFNFVRDLV